MPLAYHDELTLAVHTVMMRVIEGWYRTQGKVLGIEDGRTGSITVVQRFGSDLALNVHFHVLGLDGVYDEHGHFTAIAAPSIEQMEKLCTTIAERVQRLLVRRAIEHDEPEERALAHTLSRSAARLGTHKHAPEGADLEHDHDASWKRKARVDGFDLEATTEVRADDRERLEHLCCHLLRPPLAERRLRLLPGGTIALERPWRDGTTWLSMSAHTFLERLCSLVPRPHTNQILYRGVLAPNSARRKDVVLEPEDYARPKNATFCELMKHGLGLDVLACPCGKRMRYLATIFDRKAPQRLLTAKGVPHRIEKLHPARGPPQSSFDFGAQTTAPPGARREMCARGVTKGPFGSSARRRRALTSRRLTGGRGSKTIAARAWSYAKGSRQSERGRSYRLHAPHPLG